MAPCLLVPIIFFFIVLFTFCLELTSLDIASHGPQKVRHQSYSLVRNDLRYRLVAVCFAQIVALPAPVST